MACNNLESLWTGGDCSEAEEYRVLSRSVISYLPESHSDRCKVTLRLNGSRLHFSLSGY